MASSDKHRVVIVGGGFGGLYAAQALKHAPVEVTVLDRRNFHLFQPLLYQVATGSLSPGEIAAPIRGVLSRQGNAQVLLGEAQEIDPKTKQLTLKDGSTIPYDSLIVATGSQSSYFGNDQWSQWAPPLKTIEDATTIRHKILLAFEAAERIKDPAERQSWLTFVIVGGGPTGVELAGALGEIAHHTLTHDFRSITPSDAKIILVDAGTRLLSTYPEDLSNKAMQQLARLGVTIELGLMVTEVDGKGITAKSKSGEEHRFATHTAIWAAGVAVSAFARQLVSSTGAPTDKVGRIKVTPDLTVPGYPDIFVIGDLAAAFDKHGKPLPGVAQVAMQGGAYAAKAIKSRLQGKPNVKPFQYFNKGDLAVIGRAAAVANVFGVHLSGFLAWLVWVFIHILYIVEFQSRILVMIEWGFLYLTYDRGARLITGSGDQEAVSQADLLAASSEAPSRAQAHG